MGDRSAHDPARPARWAQTVGERARGAERDLLRAVDWLPVESAAQGSAAEEHGARLSRALELGRHLGWLAALVSACASYSEKIAATYVSPVIYEHLIISCRQIAEEAARVSRRAAEVAGVQDSQATKDSVIT